MDGRKISLPLIALVISFPASTAHAQMMPFGGAQRPSVPAPGLPFPVSQNNGKQIAEDMIRSVAPDFFPPTEEERVAAARRDMTIATQNQTATYNNLNQQVTLNGQAQTYDANGNLLSDGSRTFSWDAENRLIRITYANQPGKETSFVYNGLGQRVRKISTPAGGGSPVTTTYTWCEDKICAASNSNGVQKQYVEEGEYEPGSGQNVYYGTDHLGSVRRAFTATASPAYDYDPYGRLISPDAPITDYAYAGLMIDPDSGLYLSSTRAYDPIAGRWLSRDMIGEEADQSLNLYAYVDGDPMSKIDPEGGFGIAGAALGAAVDLGFQLYMNNGNLQCVSWTGVGVSAIMGAFGGGILNKAFVLKSGSHTWGATQRWLGKHVWDLKPGQEVHHWLIERNSVIGKKIPDYIKNQPWNLNPMKSKAFHQRLHQEMGPVMRTIRGAPPWAQGTMIGTAGTGVGYGVDSYNLYFNTPDDVQP